jgi:endonuclease YncB( thermonuclease family)
MKRILVALVLGSILIWASTDILADPTTLTGTATKVRDGDTIEVGKVTIRLKGVSAPEMNEPLGPKSKSFMTDLVMGR